MIEKSRRDRAPKVLNLSFCSIENVKSDQGSVSVDALEVDVPRGATKVNGSGDFEPMEQSP